MADVMEQYWDAIVLPGGLPGAEHLADCAGADCTCCAKQQAWPVFLGLPFVRRQALVLARHGLLRGYKATAFSRVVKRCCGKAARCRCWAMW